MADNTLPEDPLRYLNPREEARHDTHPNALVSGSWHRYFGLPESQRTGEEWDKAKAEEEATKDEFVLLTLYYRCSVATRSPHKNLLCPSGLTVGRMIRGLLEAMHFDEESSEVTICRRGTTDAFPEEMTFKEIAWDLHGRQERMILDFVHVKSALLLERERLEEEERQRQEVSRNLNPERQDEDQNDDVMEVEQVVEEMEDQEGDQHDDQVEDHDEIEEHQVDHLANQVEDEMEDDILMDGQLEHGHEHQLVARQAQQQADDEHEYPLDVEIDEEVEDLAGHQVEDGADDEATEEETRNEVVGQLDDQLKDPVEDPVEDPAEDPVDTPVEAPIEEECYGPIEKPIDGQTDNQAQNSAEYHAEDRVENPTEEPIEDPTKDRVDDPAGDAVEDPLQNPVQNNVVPTKKRMSGEPSSVWKKRITGEGGDVLKLPLMDGTVIHTRNFSLRMLYELPKRKITQTEFARGVLGMKQSYLSNLFASEDHWEGLSGTRKESWLKIKKWFEMSTEDQEDVLWGGKELIL